MYRKDEIGADKIFKSLPNSVDLLVLVFDGVCRILKTESAIKPLLAGKRNSSPKGGVETFTRKQSSANTSTINPTAKSHGAR